ncbi:hypothetical protein ACFX2C_017944 [Malus domestica]
MGHWPSLEPSSGGPVFFIPFYMGKMVFCEAIISALIKGAINCRFLKRRHGISNGSRQIDRCRVKVEEGRFASKHDSHLSNWEVNFLPFL